MMKVLMHPFLAKYDVTLPVLILCVTDTECEQCLEIRMKMRNLYKISVAFFINKVALPVKLRHVFPSISLEKKIRILTILVIK